MESHNLKEKLQNRTITPSSNSWEKLNERLTEQEDEEKGKKWLFLKYAAVLLIAVSAGFFFFQPKEDIKDNPIIVSPTLKEDIKQIPQIDSAPETEVAATPIVTPKKESVKKKPEIETIQQVSIENEAIALAEEPTKTIEKELQLEDFIIEESIVVVENNNIETNNVQQNIDLEIEQLLLKATIKRANDPKNLNKRVISANDLLFQVEEDLDKDLKQKLFDKIVKTLKNPKEVITDAGN